MDETLRYSFVGDLSNLQKSVRGATRLMDSWGAKVSHVSKTVKGALTAITGIQLGKWFASGVRESINLVENMNLFAVAVQGARKEAEKFVDTAAELYGLDQSSLYASIGGFASLLSALEAPTEAIGHLSMGAVKLGQDLSSLFNIAAEDVFEDLSSGLQGMTRAVRKYGMDVRDVTLQQTAMEIGLTDNVRTMSEVNRVGLRYLTMLRQSRLAAGDFAKTIETPANQLKIMKEQLIGVGRAIGNFFITPIASALPYINGFIMALKEILTLFATFVGFKQPIPADFAVDAADGVKDLGAAADGTAKKVKQLLAPFDELNVLSEAAGAGGGDDLGFEMDPKLLDALMGTSVEFENIRMKALDARDAILSWLGFEWTEIFNPDTGEWERKLKFIPDNLKKNLIDKFPQWTKTINAVFDNWGTIVGGFKAVWDSIGIVIDVVREKLNLFISQKVDPALADFIGNLGDNLYRLSDWITEHAEGIATFILILGGFAVFSKIAGWVTNAYLAIGLLGKAFLFLAANPVVAIIAGLALLAGAFAGLYVSNEDFRNTVDGLFAQLKSGMDELVAFFQPAIDSMVEGWETLKTVVNDLWENILKPIFKYIWDGMVQLWDQALKPVFEKIGLAIRSVIEVVMALWNNVLGPLVSWIIKTFGPGIVGVFEAVWDTIQEVIGWIVARVGEVIDVFQSVLDFLGAVFKGDWKSALNGLLNIFVSFGNLLIGSFEGAVNLIIGLFNALIKAVWSAVQSAVNFILGGLEDIAGFIGIDLNVKWTGEPPAIPKLALPRIPSAALASGGVLDSPTMALMGEGQFAEAVIPLEDSPQMEQLIDRIAEATGNGQKVEVEVKVGDERWDVFVYESWERGKKAFGSRPVKVGT